MLVFTLATKEDLGEIIKLENMYVSDSVKEIHYLDNEIIVVAKEENKLVGFLYLSQVLDESEIISICVKEEYRKKSIATNMWQYYIKKFNVNFCFLEVRISNNSALNLYNKLNFKEVGIRKNYYSNNEDAILMKWSR